MSSRFITTAATLKAILCFIDAENTPKIAFDDDSLAIPLADKLKEAIGNYDGSQTVSLIFYDDEDQLARQFKGVCGNMKEIYEGLEDCYNEIFLITIV